MKRGMHYHCPVNGWDCPYYKNSEIIDPTIARLNQVRRDIKADLDWYQANVKFGVNEAEIDVRIGEVENYLKYGIMTDDVRAALEERRKQLLLFLADINAAKVWKR